MKKIIVAFLVLFSFNSFAGLKTTRLKTLIDPSVKQIQTAIHILKEAIEAKKRGEMTLFKRKLAKAQEFQKKQKASISYKAAFITQLRDGSRINYFEVNDDDLSELRYEVKVDETCFNGSEFEAVRLLNKIITTTDILDYDEEWFDRARIQSKDKILIDYVDGPGEYTESRVISRCK